MIDEQTIEVAAEDLAVIRDRGMVVALVDDIDWVLSPVVLVLSGTHLPMRLKATGWVGHRTALWMAPEVAGEQTLDRIVVWLRVPHFENAQVAGLSRPEKS
jgi:hypothetical protein